MQSMTMGELRRIMTLYERGWTTCRIAESPGRSRSGVRRIRQQFRERGELEPMRRGDGPKPKVGPDEREQLSRLVAEQPDATLHELRERLGLDVSLSTIDRHLRTLKLGFKKRRWSPPSKTAWMSPGVGCPGTTCSVTSTRRSSFLSMRHVLRRT